ncbi:unnamed protein product, partial [Dicrocoelium dendriticum]
KIASGYQVYCTCTWLSKGAVEFPSNGGMVQNGVPNSLQRRHGCQPSKENVKKEKGCSDKNSHSITR